MADQRVEKWTGEVFADEAQLQAVYDLRGNDAVAWRDQLKPHIERTHDRARDAGDVLAVHDTTDVATRRTWRFGCTGPMSSVWT